MNKQFWIVMILSVLCLTFAQAGTDDLGLADGVKISFVDKTNAACNDSATRAMALNPATPWCNLETALDKVIGNDTVYVVGNVTYFGYFDLQDRLLNGSLRILNYPGYRPNLTGAQEAIWNATATWANVSSGGANMWAHSGDYVGSRGFVELDDGKLLMTTTTGSDLVTYGAIGMCHYNDTPNILTCRFNDTSYNPNGKKIHARGKQLYTMNFEDTDANILIAGFRIPHGDTGIQMRNVTNFTITNCSFYSNRYDIYANGVSGAYTQAIYIYNNDFTFNWNEGVWAWGDFYTGGMGSAQPVHLLFDGQSGAVRNIHVYNNTMNGTFDSIRQKLTTASSEDHEYYNNIIFNAHDDAFELGETTVQNTSIYNNFVYDVFGGISLAPASSTSGLSYIYNNLIYANKSILNTRPSTYWGGKAVKNYNESGARASINWTFSNNLLYGGGVLANSAAWETRTPAPGQVNFNNVSNCIIYSENSYAMYGSGNNTNTLFDYNDYYRAQAGNLGIYWGNESSSTGMATLAAAKAASGWPAAWDVHSLNVNPEFNTLITAYGGKSTLLWNSTLIDAGVIQPYRSLDFLYNPIYGAPDIGAVEYQPPLNASTYGFRLGTKYRLYGDGKARNINSTGSTATELYISNFTSYSATATRPHLADLIVLDDGADTFAFNVTVNTTKSLVYELRGLYNGEKYNLTIDGALISTPETNSTGDLSFVRTLAAGEHSIRLSFVPTLRAAGSTDNLMNISVNTMNGIYAFIFITAFAIVMIGILSLVMHTNTQPTPEVIQGTFGSLILIVALIVIAIVGFVMIAITISTI